MSASCQQRTHAAQQNEIVIRSPHRRAVCAQPHLRVTAAQANSEDPWVEILQHGEARLRIEPVPGRLRRPPGICAWSRGSRRRVRSALGRKRKSSTRVFDVRFSPDNGLVADISEGPLRAKTRRLRLPHLCGLRYLSLPASRRCRNPVITTGRPVQSARVSHSSSH